MPPLPSRTALEAMKRIDLQKLCKDYGVKANLKTEALIDLLLSTQSPPPRRSVSVRPPSRAGPSRTSSLIIHDTDDEPDIDDDVEAAQDKDSPTQLAAVMEQDVRPQPIPATRTRRAKETQTRLGVGRPVAAGGSGPRAVTRSTSTPRGTRGRISKSIKQTEATIIEESESVGHMDLEPHAGPSGTQNNLTPENAKTQATLSAVEKIVANAVQPLLDQVQSLKAELAQIQALRAEVSSLEIKVSNLEPLRSQVHNLTTEILNLRGLAPGLQRRSEERAEYDLDPQTPQTTFRSNLESLGLLPSEFEHNDESTPAARLSENALGKRRRQLQDLGGEAPDEGAVNSENSSHPRKKRIRLLNEKEGLTENSPEMDEPSKRLRSFSVFRGEDEPDEAVQAPLPNSFSASLGGAVPIPPRAVSSTSTAHASENNHPFSFSLFPPSSTPGTFSPGLPYPEPPQSPSPVGGPSVASANPFLGLQGGRDTYPGFLAERSSLSGPSPLSDPFLTPSALPRMSSSEKTQRVSSNEIAAGLGLTSIRAVSTDAGTPGPENPSTKKTMYGTELDGDTRFGDFGVDGVGNGFWAGGR